MFITKLCHSRRKYFATCSGLLVRFRPAFRIQDLSPFDKLKMSLVGAVNILKNKWLKVMFRNINYEKSVSIQYSFAL